MVLLVYLVVEYDQYKEVDVIKMCKLLIGKELLKEVAQLIDSKYDG